MKKVFFISAAILIFSSLKAQDKFYTKNGRVIFDATVAASPEKIEGINKTSACVLDTKTGNIQFVVLMKSFEFERALMQEHFNENYVESDKYPRTEFKGQIANNTTVVYSKEGVYPVKVVGKLTMHGVTKDIQADGKLVVKNGKISVAGNFKVPLADYGVAIPTLVADKVAKTASIDVDCTLEPLKK